MFDGFAQSDIDGYAALTKQTFLPVQEVPNIACQTASGAFRTGSIKAEPLPDDRR